MRDHKGDIQMNKRIIAAAALLAVCAFCQPDCLAQATAAGAVLVGGAREGNFVQGGVLTNIEPGNPAYGLRRPRSRWRRLWLRSHRLQPRTQPGRRELPAYSARLSQVASVPLRMDAPVCCFACRRGERIQPHRAYA